MMRSVRILAAILVCMLVAFAPGASACPTCGIGGKLGFFGPIVYGLFIAAPFCISYGIYRYIRHLNRYEK